MINRNGARAEVRKPAGRISAGLPYAGYLWAVQKFEFLYYCPGSVFVDVLVKGMVMRSSVAISLVSSLLFAGNVFAIKYTGSEQLPGYVVALPHSGGGGDSFDLRVDFQLSMAVA